MNLVSPSEMQVLLCLVLYNCKFYVWQILFSNSTGTTKDEAEETDNFPKAMPSSNIRDIIPNEVIPHSFQKKAIEWV